MDSDEILAAGFLLLRPVPQPPWIGISAELLPDRILSASTCFCPQFPGPYSISWSSYQEPAGFEEFGLPRRAREEAEAWSTRWFGKLFGWPGVFYTLGAAREARAKFFGESDLALVGIGLPAKYREEYVREAVGSRIVVGFKRIVKSGILEVVERGNPLPAGGTPLGFELLSADSGLLSCSWICNNVGRPFAKMGLRPNPAGFIDSLEEAARCCEWAQANRMVEPSGFRQVVRNSRS